MLLKASIPKVCLGDYNRFCSLTGYTLPEHSVRKNLLAWLPSGPSSTDQEMDIDSSTKTSHPELVPEAEMYLRLLILHHLLASEDTQEKALELANETAEKMQALNRRSMDAIAAKIWYAVDRAYELAGELSDARPYVQLLHLQFLSLN